MRKLARTKVPKTSHRDFLGAHRYTIYDGMCALRGVLQTAIACRGQSKGNTAFSLRCRGRTYPFAYFAFSEAPKSGALLSTKSADTAQFTVSVSHGDVLNLIQTDETDRVVERKEVPLFDNKAFREAIINAVLHNKWVEGNEPMISVFSDRIEILSRGTLAPAQTMEGFFLGESIPVNEKLSEIFLQLHISEKSGRGVPKITEMYGKDAFSFRENSIVVTIPFERINKVGNKVGKKVGDKKPLNSRRQKIIAEMRDNPNITTAELHNILGVSETAVENNISFLRENGYIERVGSKKAGYWKVL